MLPYRQSSLVQQPDGEIIRAVVDSATVQDEDLGIQFDLGLLGLKVAQEGHGVKDAPLPQTQISLPGKRRLKRPTNLLCILEDSV